MGQLKPGRVFLSCYQWMLAMRRVTHQDANQACHNLSTGKLSQHVDPQPPDSLIVRVPDRWADHHDRSPPRLFRPCQSGPPQSKTSALEDVASQADRGAQHSPTPNVDSLESRSPHRPQCRVLRSGDDSAVPSLTGSGPRCCRPPSKRAHRRRCSNVEGGCSRLQLWLNWYTDIRTSRWKRQSVGCQEIEYMEMKFLPARILRAAYTHIE